MPRRTFAWDRIVALAWLTGAVLGCADAARPPTFPRETSGAVLQEEALLSFSGDTALLARLLQADDEPPTLDLVRVRGCPGTEELVRRASPEEARAVAAEVRQGGAEEGNLARTLLRRGTFAAAPSQAALQRGQESVDLPREGARAATGQDGRGTTVSLQRWPARLLLSSVPTQGRALPARLWTSPDGRCLWLQAGSTEGRDPLLRRTVGLRRMNLAQGLARLADAEGEQARRAGSLPVARERVRHALELDPAWCDAWIHAAALAAQQGRDDDAVELLRRAALVDGARVQVLAREEVPLRRLQGRPEVRHLLGLQRGPALSAGLTP